jgi:signal transduction histidine kinase
MKRQIVGAPPVRVLVPIHSVNPREPAVVIGYVGLYIALDALSYIQPVLKLGITPWNPQAGLTLAFLIVQSPLWAFATALGAFLAEVLVRDAPASWSVLLCASAWIAVWYGCLAAVLRQWGISGPIDSMTAATRFVVAAAVTTFIVGAGYVIMFVGAGPLSINAAGGSTASYWVGDLNGILTLTPLLLLVDRWRHFWQVVRSHTGLIAAQFGAVVLTMWIIFGLPATDQLRLFYPLFVPVIWISFSWGVPGAVLSTLAIQIGLIIAVESRPAEPPLIDLQFLLLTLSLAALLLGAVVTERANALQRVAMREIEQRALLATAPDAVLTVDSGGKIRTANPAALRLFGACVRAESDPSLFSVLPGIQLNSTQGRATLEARRSDGNRFPAEISWARLDAPASGDYLVMVRDVSERQRAENQLREREIALSRAMRFAVAGELASALAHELNQPITALVSYLQASDILAAPLASQDPRLKDTLSKATHEAIRASEVLRRLRDFYRGGVVRRERLELISFCAAFAASFQERLRRAGAELLLDIPTTLPVIQAGATQLEIVLHNLLSNAIDAVSQQPPISRRIVLSGRHSAADVLLKVEDSGPGVATEVAARIFEPFVTSKVDGMGLGLAISRSLLRGQGGDLMYEPRADSSGACFIVRLPLRPPAVANG